MLHVQRKLHRTNLHRMIIRNIKRYTTGSNIIKGQRHVLTVGIDLPMYEVSKTRGVPSTSTKLKEALCEKVPIYYDLLRNFRQQHGSSVISRITVENIYQGLNGVNTMVRETSEIDPKHGIKYRGLTIPEVIMLLPREGQSPSAEAIFWLLLTGDVPTQEQTASLIADWSIRRQKRTDWWSEAEGGIVGSILRTLPKTTTPLSKLSVALTVFDFGKHMKEGLRNGAPDHTHWEYAYEDGMELLAALPAIVGLIAKGEIFKSIKEEGDWVQFLLACLSSGFNISENHKKSITDFLRLFIVLNADEGGGVPAVHVTEILGASKVDINQALAAGVLAMTNEPDNGTLSQYMEFQTKIQRFLGHEPNEEKLKDYLGNSIKRNELIGYRETEFCDPRYTALMNYARECMPSDPNIKLSQTITQVLTTLTKNLKGKKICPEQNTMAAPILQYYGMKNMEFNQVLLCMSRALGAVASIIWAKIINAPVEHPASKCTYTYLNSIQKIQTRKTRRKLDKRPHS